MVKKYKNTSKNIKTYVLGGVVVQNPRILGRYQNPWILYHHPAENLCFYTCTCTCVFSFIGFNIFYMVLSLFATFRVWLAIPLFRALLQAATSERL